jgi:hypothetical protein
MATSFSLKSVDLTLIIVPFSRVKRKTEMSFRFSNLLIVPAFSGVGRYGKTGFILSGRGLISACSENEKTSSIF